MHLQSHNLRKEPTWLTWNRSIVGSLPTTNRQRNLRTFKHIQQKRFVTPRHGNCPFTFAPAKTSKFSGWFGSLGELGSPILSGWVCSDLVSAFQGPLSRWTPRLGRCLSWKKGETTTPPKMRFYGSNIHVTLLNSIAPKENHMFFFMMVMMLLMLMMLMYGKAHKHVYTHIISMYTKINIPTYFIHIHMFNHW